MDNISREILRRLYEGEQAIQDRLEMASCLVELKQLGDKKHSAHTLRVLDGYVTVTNKALLIVQKS